LADIKPVHPIEGMPAAQLIAANDATLAPARFGRGTQQREASSASAASMTTFFASNTVARVFATLFEYE